MNPDRIRRIDNVMSGQAQDLMARLTRGGLRSLEPIYRNITRYRNRRYDRASEARAPHTSGAKKDPTGQRQRCKYKFVGSYQLCFFYQ